MSSPPKCLIITRNTTNGNKIITIKSIMMINCIQQIMITTTTTIIILIMMSL